MASPAPRPALLVAAFSARQIARSAAAAGFDVLAVDFFNDSDLARHCVASRLLTGPYPDGFSGAALLDLLSELAEGRQPVGFVYGAGFEDRPQLIAAIGERWPILGNDAATVRRLKDPMRFAADCAAAGVAHPQTRRHRPGQPDGWLAKRIGGAGGSHVVAADRADVQDDGLYFQQHVPGERVSLGFIGQRSRIDSLGLTRQWTRPVAASPFRYGGAVGPLSLPRLEAELADAVTRLARRVPLIGIGSADFVLAEEGVVLLEINPRPGATLDVHDLPGDPLLQRHLAAAGLPLRVPDGPPRRPALRASGLAWANLPLAVPDPFAWPPYAADLPRAGARIAAGEPVCTITVTDCADGSTEAMVCACFDAREAAIIASLERTAA
ncbi:ATP-grasp domain-containing protein [Aureimonas frigidaquae]|uniref:ATP-grasp domain-containing protein n=1 Tax=Aureimonas frigidaquae TaxID=424757 RepID=UPI0009F826D5|nr:ATP-grasp domain-containing protein [Aureimonas frigidaquae]